MEVNNLYVIYNINRNYPPKRISVTHVNDVSTRAIELELRQGDDLLEIDSGYTAEASIVERITKRLINNSVPCTINESGNIVIPIDDLQIRGKMDINIEVSVSDSSNNQTLVLPFPLWIRVNPSILDDAEVSTDSLGTVPKLLQEAKEIIEGERYVLTEEDKEEIASMVDLSGKEDSSLKVTSISAQSQTSDNVFYPNVNAVRNYSNAIASELEDYIDDEIDCIDAAKADKASTLSGYGINDAYTKSYIDQKLLELGGANVVNSVSDMTDTSRLYVLASTGHIWRYATVTVEPPNELDVAYYNKRISGSSGITGTAQNGAFINQKISVDLSGESCLVTMKGFADNMGAMTPSNTGYNLSKIVALDANDNILGNAYIGRSKVGVSHWACPVSGSDCVGDAVEYADQLVNNGNISAKTDIKFLVLSPQISDSSISSADVANLGIYISNHGGTRTEWVDTGIVYGGGNEEALTALDTRMTAAEQNIAALAEGSETTVIPSYWQNEVDDTVSKIIALQNTNGHDLICFGWCSDMHVDPAGCAYEKNLGAVAARVMKECDIPLMLVTGDILSAATTTTTFQNYAQGYDKAWEYLAPVGHERLLIMKGNHDAWFGKNPSDNTTYVNGVDPKELYQKLFRPQAKDVHRVFGADGTYFYLDDKPGKTRFICLNSHWAEFGVDPVTGYGTYITQKIAGYGQTQLDWLINEALNVEDGYKVIVSAHTPPLTSNGTFTREHTILRGILKAYQDKGTYSGSYTHINRGTYLQEGSWADVSVSCDFSGYHGSILGFFGGHMHRDLYENDAALGFPIISVTCAVNTPYDEHHNVDLTQRTLNTSTETAFDFVCVNRTTGAVNLIRCGYGSDRTII